MGKLHAVSNCMYDLVSKLVQHNIINLLSDMTQMVDNLAYDTTLKKTDRAQVVNNPVYDAKTTAATTTAQKPEFRNPLYSSEKKKVPSMLDYSGTPLKGHQ